VVSSPPGDATGVTPVFVRMNDPVPYVHLLEPTSKQVCPNNAACWSPAIPAMGRSRPRNVVGSVRPTTPQDGTTSGRASSGTRRISASSADQVPAWMSKSSVREALDASVTWWSPRVIRAMT
jgi:hypothetical protein